MKKIISVAVLLFVLSACTESSPPKKRYPLLEEMHWLVGTWHSVSSEGEFYEIWNSYNDSAYSGIGFMLVNGDTLFSEIITLEERNGELFYVPAVNGQNAGQPVSFKRTSGSHEEFVFENKEHDFPQRIIYTNPVPDSLYARIEGMQDGAFRQEEFALTRKK